MAKRKTQTATPVGKRIRKARLGRKMTYDDLANETGLAREEIKRIESGDRVPPVGTLLLLSRALMIDSGALLREESEKQEARAKQYTKRTENYAYTPLTPAAENKHLKAFRIVIEPMQDHKGVGYQHEGEEFAYVLTGDVEITVGEHRNRLKKGDSLHFNSGITHHMKNIGKTKAELIVTIYTP